MLTNLRLGSARPSLFGASGKVIPESKVIDFCLCSPLNSTLERVFSLNLYYIIANIIRLRSEEITLEIIANQAAKTSKQSEKKRRDPVKATLRETVG